MYKGGLVFGLIFQVFMALGFIIGGIMAVALFDSVPSAPRGVTDSFSQTTELAPVVISGAGSGIGIILGVLSIFPIVQIILTSLALSNLAKSERGERDFNKGLAIATGILCLPTNIIAGILILAGMSDAE